jgi:hypothetical protein
MPFFVTDVFSSSSFFYNIGQNFKEVSHFWVNLVLVVEMMMDSNFCQDGFLGSIVIVMK